MPPLAYVLAKCCSAVFFGILIVSLLALIGITLGH
jgi:ABC-2 type transport system permease protein